MTNLTDILSNPPAKRPCVFGAWILSLSEEDQVSVKKALLNPEWSTSKLTAALKDFGMTSDRPTVGAHRQGKCVSCGPI